MNWILVPLRTSTYATVLFVLSLAGEFSVPAASVTRGPYLQQGTPNSVVVRWRTDVVTGSALGYGISPDDFTDTITDAASLRDHAIVVTNLQPGTKYYYRIGTTNSWFTGDTNDFFITSPPVGARAPTRIWALGDSGTASAEAAAVRNAYAIYNGTRPTDVWLMLGDNAYETGTDAEYQTAVYDFYPTFLQNTVLWPTIGNHDEASLPTAYFPMFTLPQNAEAGGVASGTERYYSFDYANIHFVCLDSPTSDLSINGPMCNWLRADLEATAQDWIIAFWHHPPYSKGSHNSDSESTMVTMRQNVVPILEEFNVDLVLCGHSHSYERSFLLDGHYGNSSTLTPSMLKDSGSGREEGTGAYRKLAATPHQGAVYAVAGSSGKVSSGALNHPAMYVSLQVLGSLVIDVNSNRLDVTFLQTNATAGDHFTILKAPETTIAPAPPSHLVASAVSFNRIDLSWIDHADNERGFKLERSTNGVDFTPFVTTTANATHASDTGLAANQTYFYRARAFNFVGDSDYCEAAQATTPSPPPIDLTSPGAVNDLAVSAVSSNRATLIWTAPGDDGNTGTAARYDVRYSTSLITTSNWASAAQAAGEPAPAPGGTAHSFTVTGLAAARQYYFALRTSDEASNVSPLSNVPSVTTTPAGDITPPAAVSNLLVVSVTSSSARISWTAPGDDENIGTARTYDVRYHTSFITTSNWSSAKQASGEPTPTAAGTTQSFTISGLSSARTYYFAMKTSDERPNLSPLSNVVSTNTPPTGDFTPPAAVTNLLVMNVTSNSARLSWTAPGDDGEVGKAKSYDLRYSTNVITSSNWSSATQASSEPSPANAGTSQSFTVAKLVPGRTYYFALKTSDEKPNVSPLSNVATATTPLPPGAAVSASIVFLVPRNSVWSYLDNGSDQGTAWFTPGFDDSSWASGPAQLGYNGGHEATIVSYGGDSANKYITTYFRRHFNVANPVAFTNFSVSVQRDDGVVVYVNGTEVFRDNMPAGAINYRTVAPISVAGTDKTSFHPSPSFPSAYLVEGNNVIAAEVHQRSGSSTSMDFNLELQAILATPVVNISSGTNGEVSLSWNSYPGKRYRLQYATDFISPHWTTLGNDIIAAGFTVAVTDPSLTQRYYRVLLLD